MMLCPKSFYDEMLNDKSFEEIMTVIRGLKREIGRLKNIVEHPHYEPKICPSETVRISVLREYLEEAKKALGENYIPTKAEKKVNEFEKNIPYIEKVVFSIGGFFTGEETITYTLRNDKFCKYAEHSLYPTPSNLTEENIKIINKEKFFEMIQSLRVGEWRKKYTAERFGVKIYDGTQWDLEIYFSNGRKSLKIYGNNAYPYNFRELMDFIELEI